MIVTQVEAKPKSTKTWMLDGSNAQLSGKSIINQSASTPTGYSSHATGVAKDFSGTDSVSAAINIIRAYEAGGWATTDFLNTGTNGQPDKQIGRIANHSWVGSGFANGDGRHERKRARRKVIDIWRPPPYWRHRGQLGCWYRRPRAVMLIT